MIYAKTSPSKIFNVCSASESNMGIEGRIGTVRGLRIHYTHVRGIFWEFPGYSMKDIDDVLTGQKPFLDLTDSEQRKQKLAQSMPIATGAKSFLQKIGLG